jgi:16S rRNA (cytidine1402-2'-O)-methyltransferase
VATPIGNLGDVSMRAVETLRSVDAIAAEDTRRTRKLLAHYEIRTPLLAYHEHNEARAARAVVDKLLDGRSVALVTDAGTPLVSDPGYRLLDLAVREGIEVVAVPGPSAVVAALSISALPPMPFHFEGFLPRKSAARRTKLTLLSELNGTLVFYVSPHRVAAVLRDMSEVLGDRRAVVARELTKVHEEVLRGGLADLAREASERKLKGEIVVLVEGAG